MSLILSGTDGLSDVDGSASTPAIRGTDTNTGIFFPAADTIAFAEGGAEVARFDSSGNLGIATTSPTVKLDVTGGTTAGTSFNTLYLRGGTNGSTNSGAKMWLGAGTAVGDRGAVIEGLCTNTDNAHAMLFYTNSNAAAPAERMRIDSSGNLLVGTTDSNPNSGDGVKMNAGTGARTSIVGAADTNANFAITVYSRSPNAYRFQVGYGGTIYATSTSITAISDVSLKTNVKDLETGLSEVMALQPRRFDWINGDATNVAGFIAQEVQQVMPDLVENYQYSDNETKLGLKMGDILPTLVKAIQEQQAIITDLKSRIETLEAK